jgi:hypothetical protein
VEHGRARGQTGNRGAVETGVLGRWRQRSCSDGDVARRMGCPHGLGMDDPYVGWTGPTFDWNS